MDLDIANGQCRNDSITQNVTFGEQGGVLDSGSSSAAVVLNARTSMWVAGVLAGVAAVMGLF